MRNRANKHNFIKNKLATTVAIGLLALGQTFGNTPETPADKPAQPEQAPGITAITRLAESITADAATNPKFTYLQDLYSKDSGALNAKTLFKTPNHKTQTEISVHLVDGSTNPDQVFIATHDTFDGPEANVVSLEKEDGQWGFVSSDGHGRNWTYNYSLVPRDVNFNPLPVTELTDQQVTDYIPKLEEQVNVALRGSGAVDLPDLPR